MSTRDQFSTLALKPELLENLAVIGYEQMTPIQAQALVRGLAGLNLVGGDVVEVSPPFDPSGNTALVGATMLYEIVCVLADAVARRKGS